MFKMRACALALVGMVSVAGCGGDDSGGPAAQPGKTNPAGAKAVVTQTVSMQTALMRMDGASLSGNVNAIAISGAQQIVSPAAGQALTVLQQAQTTTPGTSGSVNCDAAGCTYNMFMVSGFTYNGSIKGADEGGGKKVTADLSIKGSVAASGVGETIDYKITGAVTVTPTSINGALQSTGAGTISGINTPGAPNSISYQHFNQVKYNNLTLANGLATGGSMYAKWAITIANVPQGSQAYEGTVTFPQ
jgi:hypothetical protein